MGEPRLFGTFHENWRDLSWGSVVMNADGASGTDGDVLPHGDDVHALARDGIKPAAFLE
jgi:hypothetical protein